MTQKLPRVSGPGKTQGKGQKRNLERQSQKKVQALAYAHALNENILHICAQSRKSICEVKKVAFTLAKLRPI